MTFDTEQQKKFDSWSKEDIYKAYLKEHETRKMFEEMVKLSQKESAKLRYELKTYKKMI